MGARMQFELAQVSSTPADTTDLLPGITGSMPRVYAEVSREAHRSVAMMLMMATFTLQILSASVVSADDSLVSFRRSDYGVAPAVVLGAACRVRRVDGLRAAVRWRGQAHQVTLSGTYS